MIVIITEELIILKKLQHREHICENTPETAYLSFPWLCTRSKRFVSVAFLNRGTGTIQHRQVSSYSML